MNLKKNILTKLHFMAVGFGFFALFIVYKLVAIQTIDGDLYKKAAVDRPIRQFKVPANRGNVYAADGNLLATSVSRYEIRLDLNTVSDKSFNDDVNKVAQLFASMFSKTTMEFDKYMRKARINNNKYLFITRNLSYTDYVKIRRHSLFGKKGSFRRSLIAKRKTVRERPIGKIAERTIGWDKQRIGADGKPFMQRVGLEGNFRQYLRGKEGMQVQQKIAKGQWKPIFNAPEIEPIDGQDIVTTLDTNIQDIAHHALLGQLEKYKAEHGTVVVMETKTGEIKAISNLGRTKKGKYYEALNYAIGERHEPGSTFKLMSMVVALEDKVIDSGTVIDTQNGKWKVGKRIVRDSHYGDGKMSAARVLEKSSNVGIAKIIHNNYKNNPQKFIDGLNRLEIGYKLGIPIVGEGEPKIPDPKDKKHWYGTTLAWMSYGYGVHITPLQTLTFYNAIANNGKMVKPMFVKQIKQQGKILKEFETEVINEKICSQSTIDKVNIMLRNVVKRGTATNIYNKNYFLAGKTGTCQLDYGKKDKEVQYVASFAGFFPADDPKYSCIVVIHRPDKKIGFYGNTVAAPVFQKIAQKLYTNTPVINEFDGLKTDYASLNKNYKKYDIKSQTTYEKIPNVKGMVGMDAVSLLENLGMKVFFKGSGKVRKQSVKAGEKINQGNKIILELS